MGDELAEHALCTYIQDEMTTFDTLPATVQGRGEDEHHTETEQSQSDSLQVRRQIARVHENMGHPSNRTLVRVLRLGGAKRRFVLAAAKHSCGVCEAQKRPAGPSIQRCYRTLPVFPETPAKKHNLPAMNIVCWCTGLQRVAPFETSRETLRTAYIWLRSYGSPASLCRSAAQLVTGIFAEKVESNGTRLEVTPLEAPWRNGKTERASKNWKEDNYNMKQDGTEAQTWTNFEEDCDVVNHSERQKSMTMDTVPTSVGRNRPQVEVATLKCGGADLGVASRQQAGELTQERSMTMRRLALQASLALDHKRRWKRTLHHAGKHYLGELHVGQPLWFWRSGANAAKKPTNAF